jgi:hypothetical protein
MDVKVEPPEGSGIEILARSGRRAKPTAPEFVMQGRAALDGAGPRL